MKEAAGWIDRYQQFWEGQFDALTSYLKEIIEKERCEWPSPEHIKK